MMALRTVELCLLIAAFFTAWWASVANAITINEYSVPTVSSGPFAITSDPNGALWFLECSANKIGRLDPATHVITEYPIPTPNSGACVGITAGPDGALWFTEGGTGDGSSGANKIGRIDPATHAITEYPIPTPTSGPAFITSGPDDALWFAEQYANQIGRIDPKTKAITEYPVPIPESEPWGIMSGPGGALWFTECGHNNRIARMDPTTHAVTEHEAYFVGTSRKALTTLSGLLRIITT